MTLGRRLPPREWQRLASGSVALIPGRELITLGWTAFTLRWPLFTLGWLPPAWNGSGGTPELTPFSPGMAASIPGGTRITLGLAGITRGQSKMIPGWLGAGCICLTEKRALNPTTDLHISTRFTPQTALVFASFIILSSRISHGYRCLAMAR